jgi:alkylation response protein AidB-like acyl-CoA dehydrogenase
VFNLQLSEEQLEFRDTVRDFVTNEVKPAAIHPDRLLPFEKPLLADALEQASRIGLRTLALSENAGGAGADMLTSVIVLEELAAGDVDLASVIAVTSSLGHLLFDRAMTPAQRKRFLPEFAEDARYHLAAATSDSDLTTGWHYHQSTRDDDTGFPTAVRHDNGDWIVNGGYACVANAPVAKLFALDVRTEAGIATLLVPRDTAGFTVGAAPKAVGNSGANGDALVRWHHGAAAPVVLKDCRIPADHTIGEPGRSALSAGGHAAHRAILTAAVNLGVGQGDYEAAVDYTKMRVQGGRPIVQHEAIGTLLANLAIKLELARNIVWKAAWTQDHPEAVSGRSVSELPLHIMARVYTGEAMHEVALGAAECFGAMGVMRDMPLQKYVHDTLVFAHSADHDSATKLQIAEAVAGFERPQAGAAAH